MKFNLPQKVGLQRFIVTIIRALSEVIADRCDDLLPKGWFALRHSRQLLHAVDALVQVIRRESGDCLVKCIFII